MNEKMKFVIRYEDGEKMTDLCKEFGIARKTGYKLCDRYKENGLLGMYDQKRGPKNAANLTPDHIQKLIIEKKGKNKTWGAPKIQAWLVRKYPDLHIPVKSTVHAILDRNNLVKKRRKRSPYKSCPTYLSIPKNPNDLWCADFKGQFRMKNREYCYPLTITDQESRFLLCCEGLDSVKAVPAMEEFERTFKEYGLPEAIRTDNGEPFSSRSIWGLSILSIWWLRLGIKLERAKPGHPQDNGRHERMHRTLKMDATKPPGESLIQQQEMFDNFVTEYNFDRPHEALKMRCPGDVYTKSESKYSLELSELKYDNCDHIKTVSKCGSLSVGKSKRVFISEAFRGQPLGITEIDDDMYQVDFMNYKLGFFDGENYKLAIADSPFIEESVT